MLQSIPFYKWCVPPSLSPLRVAFRPNMSDHDPNNLNWDLGAYDECLDQLVDARDVGDRLRYLWSLRRANSWACMASALVSAQFQRQIAKASAQFRRRSKWRLRYRM